MTETKKIKFIERVIRPQQPGMDFAGFVILPKAVSQQLPRRGRTTVDLVVAAHQFQVTLEPDGNLSHWVKLSEDVMLAGQLEFNAKYTFYLSPVKTEPEPKVPKDLAEAIHQSNVALETWQQTTTLARVDWVHWVESAKQAKTRAKRVTDACGMLAAGKRRVCCFDHSGFYSKALKAPKA